MEKKKKVLLIDDEEDFCFFVKSNLEKSGEFEVAYVTDAHEGINAARKNQPDLILLDILMPKMGGSEVAEVLSVDPQTKGIPFIFLTAVVTEAEIGLGALKKIGGQDFIAKPVDTKKLIGCIKTVLAQKAGI